jgi:hypothetical protein
MVYGAFRIDIYPQINSVSTYLNRNKPILTANNTMHSIILLKFLNYKWKYIKFIVVVCHKFVRLKLIFLPNRTLLQRFAEYCAAIGPILDWAV